MIFNELPFRHIETFDSSRVKQLAMAKTCRRYVLTHSSRNLEYLTYKAMCGLIYHWPIKTNRFYYQVLERSKYNDP